jgi:hypothetical protein
VHQEHRTRPFSTVLAWPNENKISHR